MRLLVTPFILLSCIAYSFGQDFSSPIKHEIKLAGTFGELRSNHFHMGLDIKSSRGKHPDAILAADAGFISRIKVSRSGYGNALYINHPTGYTTVYGHLSSFSPFIDSLVNRVQRDSQSFEIDYYLDSTQLFVLKSQEIAKMGNSGSSAGPHLHFEIRKTKSELPVNPMLFNIKPVDSSTPLIKKIKFFILDNNLQEIGERIVTPGTTSNGRYRLEPMKVAGWRTAIGVQTYDPMNVYNKNGIYKLELSVDDTLVYDITFDSISFDDTRYLNAHMDYRYFREKRSRLHRCFVLPGNKLPNIASNNAVIRLYKDKPRKVILRVFDFELNMSEVKFDILRAEEMLSPKPVVFNYSLSYAEANVIEENALRLHFSKNTLYEDLRLYVSSSESEYKSRVYHIGDKSTPLHLPARIFIDGSNIPAGERDKICLLECSNSNRIYTYGGSWNGDFFESSILSFGNYALGMDTIPPSIRPLQSGGNFSSRPTISYEILDNFSNSGKAKGLEYHATIDGVWAKFNYDLKRDRLTHRFEEPASGKSHMLILSVTDDRGNTKTLEKKFTR